MSDSALEELRLGIPPRGRLPLSKRSREKRRAKSCSIS